jgi:hypothetical protein
VFRLAAVERFLVDCGAVEEELRLPDRPVHTEETSDDEDGGLDTRRGIRSGDTAVGIDDED